MYEEERKLVNIRVVNYNRLREIELAYKEIVNILNKTNYKMPELTPIGYTSEDDYIQIPQAKYNNLKRVEVEYLKIVDLVYKTGNF